MMGGDVEAAVPAGEAALARSPAATVVSPGAATAPAPSPRPPPPTLGPAMEIQDTTGPTAKSVSARRMWSAAAFELLGIHLIILAVIYSRLASGGLGGGDAVWTATCTPVDASPSELLPDTPAALTDNTTATQAGVAGTCLPAYGCPTPAGRAIRDLPLAAAMGFVHIIVFATHTALLALFPHDTRWTSLHAVLAGVAVLATILTIVDVAVIHDTLAYSCDPAQASRGVHTQSADPGVAVHYSWRGDAAANIALNIVLPVACELALLGTMVAPLVAGGLVGGMSSLVSEASDDGSLGGGGRLGAEEEVFPAWGEGNRRSYFRTHLSMLGSVEGSARGSLRTGVEWGHGSWPSTPRRERGDNGSGSIAQSWRSSRLRIPKLSSDEQLACALHAVALAACCVGDYAAKTFTLRVRYYWQVPMVAGIIDARHRPTPILPQPRVQLIDDIAEEVQASRMARPAMLSGGVVGVTATPVGSYSIPPTPLHPNLVHTASDEVSPKRDGQTMTIPMVSPPTVRNGGESAGDMVILSPLTPTMVADAAGGAGGFVISPLSQSGLPLPLSRALAMDVSLGGTEDPGETLSSSVGAVGRRLDVGGGEDEEGMVRVRERKAKRDKREKKEKKEKKVRKEKSHRHKESEATARGRVAPAPAPAPAGP